MSCLGERTMWKLLGYKWSSLASSSSSSDPGTTLWPKKTAGTGESLQGMLSRTIKDVKARKCWKEDLDRVLKDTVCLSSAYNAIYRSKVNSIWGTVQKKKKLLIPEMNPESCVFFCHSLNSSSLWYPLLIDHDKKNSQNVLQYYISIIYIYIIIL